MRSLHVALFACLALICLLATPGYSQQSQGGASPATPAPSPNPATQQNYPIAASGTQFIPDGTEVKVSLSDELKSGQSNVGDEVHFTVVNDVFSRSQQLLIPRGAQAYGKVTESKRRRMFGQPGKLDFTCEYVILPGGTQVPLRSQKMSSQGQDNRGASLAVSLLLFWPAMFMSGRDVSAHPGQEFTMYVDHDTPITIAAAPPTAAQPTVAKSLFVLASGGQVVGSLVSFDGQSYVVGTDQGNITLKATDIKAVYAITNNLPPAPAAAPAPSVLPAQSNPPAQPASPAAAAPQSPPAPSAPPAAPQPPPAPPTPPAAASPPPAPAPQSPPASAPQPPPPAIDPSVIGTSQHVIVTLNNENSYYGTITKLDGSAYTLVTKQGTIQVQTSDIKSVDYPDK